MAVTGKGGREGGREGMKERGRVGCVCDIERMKEKGRRKEGRSLYRPLLAPEG